MAGKRKASNMESENELKEPLATIYKLQEQQFVDTTSPSVFHTFCNFAKYEKELVKSIFSNYLSSPNPYQEEHLKCIIPLFRDNEHIVYQNRRKNCQIETKEEQFFVYYFVQCSRYKEDLPNNIKVKEYFSIGDTIVYKCSKMKGELKYKTITSELYPTDGKCKVSSGWILINSSGAELITIDVDIQYYTELNDPSIKNKKKKIIAPSPLIIDSPEANKQCESNSVVNEEICSNVTDPDEVQTTIFMGNDKDVQEDQQVFLDQQSTEPLLDEDFNSEFRSLPILNDNQWEDQEDFLGFDDRLYEKRNNPMASTSTSENCNLQSI